MIRLWLCIGLLGGTVAFLSCSSDQLDNGGGGGHGGSNAGGHGGTPMTSDGSGPMGDASGPMGDGGGPQPCDGLAYFTALGTCESTYAAQVARKVPGLCDYVRVLAGSCNGQQVWTTRYTDLGDPVVCVYDSVGKLVAARVCSDAPVADWKCPGSAELPSCLVAGTVPDIIGCTLTDSCDGSGGHGSSGNGGHAGSVSDGGGPVGGGGGSVGGHAGS